MENSDRILGEFNLVPGEEKHEVQLAEGKQCLIC